MTTFETLCEENYTRIYMYILGMTGRKEAAQDLTQDVFLIAYQKKKEFTEHEKPVGFLYVTARNMTLSYFRKQKQEIPTELDTMEEMETVAGNGEMDLLEDILKSEDQKIEVEPYKKQVLSQLTEMEKYLYDEYYHNNKSMNEIAKDLHIREVTLRMKYVRLRKRVKKLVEELSLETFSY